MFCFFGKARIIQLTKYSKSALTQDNQDNQDNKDNQDIQIDKIYHNIVKSLIIEKKYVYQDWLDTHNIIYLEKYNDLNKKIDFYYNFIDKNNNKETNNNNNINK